jgi:hypothetical protein
MIGTAVHRMKKPAAYLAMERNRVIDDAALPYVKKHCLFGH